MHGSRCLRDRCLVLLVPVLAGFVSASVVRPAKSPGGSPQRLAMGAAIAVLDRVPLYFEQNLGQFDSPVQFVAKAGDYTMFLTSGEAVMVLSRDSDQAVIKMTIEGAGMKTPAQGLERQPGISAYFVGNDPRNWRPEVPHYARVECKNVYPGIDLIYYGDRRQVEYDFRVAPGADPSQIRLAYQGAEGLRVDSTGDLLLATKLGEVRQRKPRVYQEAEGRLVAVEAGYRLKERQVEIALADYDHSRTLVVDPVLAYSSLIGSTLTSATGVAVDATGAVYVAGSTRDINFPSVNNFDPLPTYYSPTWNYSIFVTKINPNAGGEPLTLAYSAYFGGRKNESYGSAITVDTAGAVYLAGTTTSEDFPNLNAFQTSFNPDQGPSFCSSFTCEDGFVAKLNAYGGAGPVTLAYASYLGGGDDDYAQAIAVDATGAAYVTGWTHSTNFPLLNAFQTDPPEVLHGSGVTTWTTHAFVTKLNPSTGGPVTLGYSTYFGGRDMEHARAIAVDNSGAAYITGETGTQSALYAGLIATNFPIVNAYKVSIPINGYTEGFVAKFNPHSGTGPVTLAYSTYLGGSTGDSPAVPEWDTPYAIAVDQYGAAYVAGNTEASNFPVVHAYQALNLSHGDQYIGWGTGFVSKLDATGRNLLYSTHLGGTTTEAINGIAVDPSGAVYVTGSTASSDFPVLNGYPYTGEFEAFLAKLDPGLSGADSLLYSTYLGGAGSESGGAVAVGPDDAVYVAGYVAKETGAPYFPLVHSLAATHSGQAGFVMRLNQAALTVAKSHTGSFTQSEQGALYSVTVSNAADALASTKGTVTVVENLPAGLTLASLAGSGWTCTTNTCSRDDELAPGSSYPPITVTVNVNGDAVSPQVNQVTVTGGGATAVSASDSTVILPGPPALSVTKTHAGNFTQGQKGATYRLTVSNVSASSGTSGTVTVTDSLPAGLSLVSMAGGGWACVGTTCTRSDSLAAGATYPVITVTVDVAEDASSPQVNQVTVSGGGAADDSTTDSTTVTARPAALSITKTHDDDCTQGEKNAEYTVIATNGTGAGPTSGKVAVTEAVPAGLTLVSMAGSGWTCSVAKCERSDSLAGGTSYPPITVTVDVAPNATSPQVNSVSVTGGGSATARCDDPTVILADPTRPAVLSISKTHSGSFRQGDTNVAYSVAVSNSATGGPTDGTVTVTENPPSGLTLVSMAGTGWTCAGNACSRPDKLNGGASYPPITVRMNVAANASSPQVNAVTVTGGGADAATARDSTVITKNTNRPILTTTLKARTGLRALRRWTFLVRNTGGGPAVDLRFTGLALTQTAGAACSPVLKTPLPLVVGNVPAGGSIQPALTIDFSGCPSSGRFTAVLTLSVKNGNGPRLLTTAHFNTPF